VHPRLPTLFVALLATVGLAGCSAMTGEGGPSTVSKGEAAHGEHTEDTAAPAAPAPVEPITEDSSCEDYQHASKKEREDVGQVAVFNEATYIFVEGDCERHPSERVRFAYCEVIEALNGIDRGVSGGEGLSAGERAALRERYPWCF
jgi:hypothetical protein